MAGSGDNAGFTREVGHPSRSRSRPSAMEDYATAVELLRPVRSIAHRFGGSHAQRDVIDLTLIEAAFRAGDTALAGALSAERAAARPDSPLSQFFMRRADRTRRQSSLRTDQSDMNFCGTRKKSAGLTSCALLDFAL